MGKNLLTGENLILRVPEPADIDFILKMENDPETWHFGNTVIPYSRYQIEQWVLSTQHDIYAERQLRMMIETKPGNEKNRLIGAIDLFDFESRHRRSSIGILIVPDERGKGYAAEALQLLVNYCFSILEIHQLFCTVTVDNSASIRLFEQAGFIRCGTRKEWIHHDGQWLDEAMFQLIHR